MNKITIPCPCCGGTGCKEFNGIYADTLVLLKRSGEITGAKLARKAGCKGPTMNNRLAALERLGLATSRQYGRERLYQAVNGRK